MGGTAAVVAAVVVEGQRSAEGGSRVVLLGQSVVRGAAGRMMGGMTSPYWYATCTCIYLSELGVRHLRCEHVGHQLVRLLRHLIRVKLAARAVVARAVVARAVVARAAAVAGGGGWRRRVAAEAGGRGRRRRVAVEGGGGRSRRQDMSAGHGGRRQVVGRILSAYCDH